ncbi:hypothetical protein GALL_383410 [mine drainage metagenome]|uniref:Uncharacterized protein n=1 Tax=mine drainage metagenome TaxID=410659 RepID=A0A1J5QIV9_9ZZZZ
MTSGLPLADEPWLPPRDGGRYARWNIDGRVVPRRDLPKVMKGRSFESPNFGDWSRGSHTVTQYREVFQKEIRYGRQSRFEIEARVRDDGVDVVYVLEDVFDSAEHSERELLFALSLAQETFGDANVIASTVTVAQWLDRMHVDWEFIPSGTLDERLREIVRRVRIAPESHRAREVEDRIGRILAMNPTREVVGTSGMCRYVGYQFADDLMVFENAEYGNAIYVMYSDWDTLSKLTKPELLSLGPDRPFDRVVHRGQWEQSVAAYIAAHRQGPDSGNLV